MRLAKSVFGVWYGSDGVEPGKNGAESVCILNGIHRGAVVGIGDSAVSVGGIPGCTAQIADGSAVGCSVDFVRNQNGDVIVTMNDGTIRVGRRSMRAERPVTLPKGVILRMGDVCLARGSDLSAVQKEVRSRERQRTAFKWVAALAASLTLVGGVGVVGSGSAGALMASANAEYFQASPVSLTQVSDTAAGALEIEIARAGLSDALRVQKLDSSGEILVTGAVSPDERERWSSVAQWFDGRFGGRVMLETDLTAREKSLMMPFRITSVVMAPNPRVVIQDGRVFPVGAVLPGGWEILGIAGMKVVLSRGNREVKIAF